MFDSIKMEMNNTPELEEILSYKYWRHRISLGNGVVTPGYKTEDEWLSNFLPPNLNGKSFLDVGANDGMFSFLAEKKGASEIFAIDRYKMDIDTMKNGWSNIGINLVKKYLNSKVNVVDLSIHDLNKLERKFDVVYCADVLAWIDDLPLALKKLAEITNETLIIKDGFWKKIDNYPVLRYEIGKPYKYRANTRFITDILEKEGFKNIKVKSLNISDFFEKQFHLFPSVSVLANTPVYNSPFASEPYRLSQAETIAQATGEINNRFYIRNLGWIKTENIKINYAGINKGKLLIKSIFGKKLIGTLKKHIWEYKNDDGAFTITATR